MHFESKACDNQSFQANRDTYLTGFLCFLSFPVQITSSCLESAEIYFSGSYNLEKHLFLSGCSLIIACFWRHGRQGEEVWKFTFLCVYGFMVNFILKVFNTSSASCHDQCHDLEDFSPKKTQMRGIVSRTVNRVLKMSILHLGFQSHSLFFYLLIKIFFIS